MFPATKSLLTATPQQESRTLPWARLVSIVAATCLLAVASHISFPLPFTPVPITMQTFAVLLIAIVLRPVDAGAAMALYLVEGALGAPVFSPQGAPGVARLVGPTGGFLLAYPFAASLASSIFRSARLPFSAALRALVAGASGLLPVFLLGSVWLAAFTHASLGTAARLAILPFLPGEVLKLGLLAAIAALGVRPRQQVR